MTDPPVQGPIFDLGIQPIITQQIFNSLVHNKCPVFMKGPLQLSLSCLKGAHESLCPTNIFKDLRGCTTPGKSQI